MNVKAVAQFIIEEARDWDISDFNGENLRAEVERILSGAENIFTTNGGIACWIDGEDVKVINGEKRLCAEDWAEIGEKIKELKLK